MSRRRGAVPRNHNTSDALLIGGTIAAGVAFFWWLAKRSGPRPANQDGLAVLGAE